MNLFHITWLAFLVIAFVLALWIGKGVGWSIPLAFVLVMTYKALSDSWGVFVFPFIIGIFLLSLMGFIHDTLEGNLW